MSQRRSHTFRLRLTVAVILAAAPWTLAAQGSTTASRTYSVTVIDSALLHTVPTGTPIAALVGKVPGGRVVATTNAPGSAPTIYLRGAIASMEGDPLIVVDGVVSPLTLADITTADVERIEVLPGAAAGAAWGLRGANGVVSITTRRAQTPFLIARSNVSQTSIAPQPLPSQHHAYQLDANGNFVVPSTGGRLPEPDGIMDNPYPVSYDLRGAVLRQRVVLSNYVAAGRHFQNSKTRVAASAGDDHDQGVLARLSGYSRTTGRVAVDHSPIADLDLSLDAFGARVSDNAPGFQSPFVVLSAVEASVSRDSATPANPWWALKYGDAATRHDRSGWSARAEYRPLPWLWIRAVESRDRAKESVRQRFGSITDVFIGSTRVANGTDRAATTEASLGARGSFFRGAVRAGARFAFARQTHRTSGDTTFISSLSPPSPDPFPSVGSSFWRRQHFESYVVSTDAQVGEHIALDALIRKDKTGYLVDTRHGLWYHRLSGAYTLGSTRLHLAQGTAAPAIENTLRTAPFILCPISPPGGIGGPPGCGGPAIRMPHAREIEAGIAHAFRQRADVHYTFSRQRTTDVMFVVPGFSSGGSALANVASTVAVSHELSGSAHLVARPQVGWDMRIVAQRVRARARDMGPFAFIGIGTSEFYQPFRITNGDVLGVMYGTKAVRTAAQLDETIRSGHLTGTTADYALNDEGYFVRAADLGTPNERPLIAYPCAQPAPATCTSSSTSFSSYVPIGDANPDLELGLNTSLRWRTFTAYATVNVVRGGDVYNAARQFRFRTNTDPVFDQSAKPAAERKGYLYYNWFGYDPKEYFVEDGSYVKLSELAVDWQVRGVWSVGLVGRNLFTSSGYSGYDPDAASGISTMFANRLDGIGYPAYRTLGVRVQRGLR